MSEGIQTWFVNQYSANVQLLMQQRTSRLDPYMRHESQQGLMQFWDQVGVTDMQEKTVRHGDTPNVEVEEFRRATITRDWEWAKLIDPQDMNRLLGDPKSRYMLAAQASAARRRDKQIIDAALGTALQDDGSYTGATVPVALPASQKIPANYLTGINSGLTLEKLIRAKSLLKKAEPDESERFVLVVSQAQIDDMLEKIVQVGSADFNSTKPFVEGNVPRFMGFDIVVTELLPIDPATGVRQCFGFTTGSLLLATGEGITTRLTERDDKSYAIQPYMRMSFGATRMQEKGVVEIAVESPTDK